MQNYKFFLIVMKLRICVAVTLAVIAQTFFIDIAVNAQQPEEPDMFEMAEKEADRLQRLLDLEDWQVFYVDSTLKHDYPAMIAEYKELQSSKVSNTSLYQSVNDKWLEKIDATYRRIFTEKQWAAYLKSGAAKAQKARDKRKAKAQNIESKR